MPLIRQFGLRVLYSDSTLCRGDLGGKPGDEGRLVDGEVRRLMSAEGDQPPLIWPAWGQGFCGGGFRRAISQAWWKVPDAKVIGLVVAGNDLTNEYEWGSFDHLREELEKLVDWLERYDVKLVIIDAVPAAFHHL